MPAVSTVLPIALRFLTPTLKKRAAERAAGYLNQRRETRLTSETNLATANDIDPELLKQLCARQVEQVEQVEINDAGASASLSALLGGLAGAIVGVGLYFIYLHRERLRQRYLND